MISRLIRLTFLIFIFSPLLTNGQDNRHADSRFKIKLNLPYFNNISAHPYSSQITKTGFIGEGIGFGWMYREHSRYLEIDFGLQTTSPFILPGPYKRTGNYDNLSSFLIRAMNYHQQNKWLFGYGINYSNYLYVSVTESNPPDSISRVSEFTYLNTIGASLETSYRIGKTFALGISYNGSFLRLGPKPGITYNHTISLQFLWRLGIFMGR